MSYRMESQIEINITSTVTSVGCDLHMYCIEKLHMVHVSTLENLKVQ